MTDKHVFNFATKWELFDTQGKLVKSAEDVEVLGVEGEIELKTKDTNLKQPMKSFVKRFLNLCILRGVRIWGQTTTWGSTYSSNYNGILMAYKETHDPVNMNNAGWSYHFSTTDDSYPSQDASKASFFMDNIVKDNDSIIVKFGLTCPSVYFTKYSGTVTATSTLINELGIGVPSVYAGNYSTTRHLIAHDFLDQNFTVQKNTPFTLAYTLRFPSTSTKTIHKNWILNLLQVYHKSGGPVFDVDDQPVNLVAMSGDTSDIRNYSSFTRLDLGANHGSIRLGSSTELDWTSNNLSEPYTSEFSSSNKSFNSFDTEPNVSEDAKSAWMTYSTDFTNTTDSTKMVNEAGIFVTVRGNGVNNGLTVTTNDRTFLLFKWLTGGVEVPAGYKIRVYFQPIIYC